MLLSKFPCRDRTAASISHATRSGREEHRDDAKVSASAFYSVAQCYRIIWAGAQQATDFLVRKRCNTKHAANFMIGECQRWADRARAEMWEVKPFKRNFNLPRSSISHVFFDVFLKIGEAGFNWVPGSLQCTAPPSP